MPKVKIPRKSTSVDMTAMCDVAFLLLSFFILATKQKPPEVLAVNPPNSVSTKVASEKAILVTLTKDGRTFLMLGEDTKKKEVLENINLTKALGLTPQEIDAWDKQEFVGLPLGQIKASLASNKEMDPATLPGIPMKDTTDNEMVDWMASITNVFAANQMDHKVFDTILLVKGDNEALYPKFKAIKYAFKKNEIFKFKIVTNGKEAPIGSELFLERKKGVN
jgi:biopolymer transport protein ExbD